MVSASYLSTKINTFNKPLNSSYPNVMEEPEYSSILFHPARKYPYKNLNDCLNTFSLSAYNLKEPFCNATYDTILCWPPTKPGVLIKQSCPPLKGIDTAKYATRKCSANGLWLDRSLNPVSSTKGWTNFSVCYKPETDELYKKIRPHIELFSKVSYSTRLMEMVGLSISLLSLLIALFIFSSFRSLKNDRTKIHRNLFIAMTMLVIIRLTLYSDQFATKSLVLIGIPKTSEHRGIDNTDILCESFYIVYEYAKTGLFMWMLVEGFYLHHIIVSSVFESKPNILIFHAVGWGIPFILTAIWAGVYSQVKNKSKCWFLYSFARQYWILEGPRMAVIIINLLFLLNIIRVLVSKLRDTHSSEAEQAKKAVKAALVLLPLLGITNSINLLPTPWKLIPFVIWMYGAYFLVSFQGLFVSLIYCFCNQEVRDTLRSAWRRRSVYHDGTRPSQASIMSRLSIFRGSLVGHQIFANTTTPLKRSNSVTPRFWAPSPVLGAETRSLLTVRRLEVGHHQGVRLKEIASFALKNVYQGKEHLLSDHQKLHQKRMKHILTAIKEYQPLSIKKIPVPMHLPRHLTSLSLTTSQEASTKTINEEKLISCSSSVQLVPRIKTQLTAQEDMKTKQNTTINKLMRPFQRTKEIIWEIPKFQRYNQNVELEMMPMLRKRYSLSNPLLTANPKDINPKVCQTIKKNGKLIVSHSITNMVENLSIPSEWKMAKKNFVKYLQSDLKIAMNQYNLPDPPSIPLPFTQPSNFVVHYNNRLIYRRQSERTGQLTLEPSQIKQNFSYSVSDMSKAKNCNFFNFYANLEDKMKSKEYRFGSGDLRVPVLDNVNVNSQEYNKINQQIPSHHNIFFNSFDDDMSQCHTSSLPHLQTNVFPSFQRDNMKLSSSESLSSLNIFNKSFSKRRKTCIEPIDKQDITSTYQPKISLKTRLSQPIINFKRQKNNGSELLSSEAKALKFEGVKVYPCLHRPGYYEGLNETTLIFDMPENWGSITPKTTGHMKNKKSDSIRTCITYLTNNSTSSSPL